MRNIKVVISFELCECCQEAQKAQEVHFEALRAEIEAPIQRLDHYKRLKYFRPSKD